MEKILREVLLEDKSLLCRRDELITALQNKVPANKSRDFASIKRALALNVGEKFFVGKSDKEATKTEIAKILKEGGLQEARVNFVIETFVKALDWDKPITPTLEKKSDTAKSVAFPSVAEVFKKAKAEQKVSTTTPQKTNQQLTPKPTTPQQQSPPKPSTPPQQPATAPSNKNNQSATTLSTNQKNLFIGVLCFLMLMLFFAAGRDSNPSTLTPDSSTPSLPPEDTSYLNARTDLSLNGIDLGLDVQQMVKFWGEPREKERREDGFLTYYYGSIAVGIVDGKVHSFVTDNPKFKTKRGLHVGSSYSEVMDAYGTNSIDMQADNLTLREYPFTSLDGKKSLLRFAINSSGQVVYISIRIVDNPSPLGENWIKDDNGVYLWNPEPQEGERITWSGGFVQDGNYKFAEGTGVVKWYNKNGEIVQTDEGTLKHGQRHGKFKHTFKSGNVEYINWENGKEIKDDIDDNTRQAATAFLRFHEAISNKDYSVAFNLFTDRRQEEMDYNLRAFAQGYSNTITSEITDLELVSSSNNRVVMNYILDARDRAGGGRTLYQQFSGQVEMVKVGGEWKIAATQSKRIKEVMER